MDGIREHSCGADFRRDCMSSAILANASSMAATSSFVYFLSLGAILALTSIVHIYMILNKDARVLLSGVSLEDLVLNNLHLLHTLGLL